MQSLIGKQSWMLSAESLKEYFLKLNLATFCSNDLFIISKLKYPNFQFAAVGSGHSMAWRKKSQSQTMQLNHHFKQILSMVWAISPARLSINCWGWRVYLAVKSTCYSHRGPRFNSSTHMVAHNHPTSDLCWHHTHTWCHAYIQTIHTTIYTYICIYVYTHTHIYILIFTRIHTYIHTHLHSVCVLSKCICVCTCMYMYIQIYRDIYTYMYICQIFCDWLIYKNKGQSYNQHIERKMARKERESQKARHRCLQRDDRHQRSKATSSE